MVLAAFKSAIAGLGFLKSEIEGCLQTQAMEM